MACRDVISFANGRKRSSSRNCSLRAVTDDLGNFELERVAQRGVYLVIDGNGIMTRRFGDRRLGLQALTDRAPDDLEIVVNLKMAMRVVAPSSFADSFAVL